MRGGEGSPRSRRSWLREMGAVLRSSPVQSARRRTYTVLEMDTDKRIAAVGNAGITSLPRRQGILLSRGVPMPIDAKILEFGGPAKVLEDRIKRVSRQALGCSLAVVRWLAPDGKLEGSEWVCLNPHRDDHSHGSLKVNTATGKWGEFKPGGKGGGDLVGAVEYFLGCSSMGEACEALERFLGAAVPSAGREGTFPRQKEKFEKRGMQRKPAWFPELGKPDATWVYRDAGGAFIGEVWRWNATPGREKQIRPLLLGADGLWCWTWPASPRPLFNLDRIAAIRTPILLCEGEKSADAAEVLFPGAVASTAMSGARSVAATAWGPLAGRHVLVWADADTAGDAYAEAVIERAFEVGAASVRRLVLSSVGIAAGSKEDAADLVARGWNAARFAKESRWDVVESPAKEKVGGSDEFETGQITRDRLDDPAHPGPGAVDELPTIDPVAERVQGEAGAGEDVEPLEVTPWADVESRPLRFLMQHYLPAGEVAILGANGGCGKSFVALSWAAHIAAGRAWGPLAVSKGKVLFLSFEDPAHTMKYRLMNIIEEHGLDGAAVFGGIDLVDATGFNALAFERSEGGVKRLEFSDTFARLKVMASGYSLIIIDNASECFDGDENSKRQVKTFIKALKRTVVEHDGCVLLLNHIDKHGARNGTNGNSYSGSAAWNNSPRSRIALVGDELIHEKLNGGRKREEPMPIFWTNSGEKSVPVPDAFGTMRAKLITDQFNADDTAALAALGEAIEAGERVWASASAFDVLVLRPGFPTVFAEDKRRLLATLARLETQGRIAKVEVKDKTTNYRPRQFWEVSRVD